MKQGHYKCNVFNESGGYGDAASSSSSSAAAAAASSSSTPSYYDVARAEAHKAMEATKQIQKYQFYHARYAHSKEGVANAQTKLDEIESLIVGGAAVPSASSSSSAAKASAAKSSSKSSSSSSVSAKSPVISIAATAAAAAAAAAAATPSITYTLPNVTFLNEVLEKLQYCRAITAWTYALAYYMKAGRQKNLFEHQQSLLEQETESLQELLDADPPPPTPTAPTLSPIEHLLTSDMRKCLVHKAGAMFGFCTQMVNQVKSGDFDCFLQTVADTDTDPTRGWGCTHCNKSNPPTAKLCETADCKACRVHGELDCRVCVPNPNYYGLQ
jgi:hypothetical protein